MKTKISSFALITTLAVVSASGSAAPIYEAPIKHNFDAHGDVLGTSAPLLSEPQDTQDLFIAQRHEIFSELMSYMPGAGDPGIESSVEDIVTAIKIIRAIPDDFPLPTLMRDDQGQIGMYWDDRNLYIDINIEENAMFSFFSRSRATKNEIFFDDLKLSMLDRSWFNAQFGTFARS
jgi:hypothetical protein